MPPKPPKKPAWWTSMMQSLNQIPVGGASSPIQSSPMPAWLQPKPPNAQGSSLSQKIQDKLNQLGTPSGLGGGSIVPLPQSVTQYNQPATYPLTITQPATHAPTTVDLPYIYPSTTVGPAGNPASTYVIGPNGAPMRVNMGPLPSSPTTPATDYGSYSGGGYGYNRRRRGGGGYRRGYQPYAPQDQTERPAWANRGLANWTIG